MELYAKEKEQYYTLSLDASSSEIGYCIWNNETKKLKFAGHLTLNENFNTLDKAVEFSNLISNLQKDYHITDMVIEKAFEAMFGGASNTGVTALLQKLNFCYQYICYVKGMKVHVISVSDCRKFAWTGITFPRKDDMIKPFILDLFVKEEGDNFLEKRELTRTSKAGKKGEKVYKTWCYDISDSYTVGKAYFNILAKGLTPERITELKVEKKKELKLKKKLKKLTKATDE